MEVLNYIERLIAIPPGTAVDEITYTPPLNLAAKEQKSQSLVYIWKQENIQNQF